MLTSILQANGKRTLGKITGSSACLLLPDGNEIPVRRNHIPTIMEQKSVLRKAAALSADCLICEIMSIHAENRLIESQKLLKAHITIITNVRQDHIEAMGRTERAIAEHYCLDIARNAAVFAHDDEHGHQFKLCTRRKNGSYFDVKKGLSKSLLKSFSNLEKVHYPENLDLVCAVSRHLGIQDGIILKGLQNMSSSDSFHVYKIQKSEKTVYCADVFGANDPESTFRAITKMQEMLPPRAGSLAGILSLRTDRGDRTLQWIQTLSRERDFPFKEMFVLGRHGRIVQRAIKRGHLIREKDTGKIMQTIVDNLDDHSVIVGIGNKKGIGSDLAAYWEREGVDAGL